MFLDSIDCAGVALDLALLKVLGMVYNSTTTLTVSSEDLVFTYHAKIAKAWADVEDEGKDIVDVEEEANLVMDEVAWARVMDATDNIVVLDPSLELTLVVVDPTLPTPVLVLSLDPVLDVVASVSSPIPVDTQWMEVKRKPCQPLNDLPQKLKDNTWVPTASEPKTRVVFKSIFNV